MCIRDREQYVYASEMKLLGAVSAQRLDVVLMDEYARDRLLADDYFLDLRDVYKRQRVGMAGIAP